MNERMDWIQTVNGYCYWCFDTCLSVYILFIRMPRLCYIVFHSTFVRIIFFLFYLRCIKYQWEVSISGKLCVNIIFFYICIIPFSSYNFIGFSSHNIIGCSSDNVIGYSDIFIGYSDNFIGFSSCILNT